MGGLAVSASGIRPCERSYNELTSVSLFLSFFVHLQFTLSL